MDNLLVTEAYKAMRKHPCISSRDVFKDPDPLLAECVKMLLKNGLYLAQACRAAVALKREFS